MISPFLPRTTSWGSTSATSSAIKPYCCRAFPVAVVFEGYWLEPVQRFAGLVHRLNVVFEAPGRRVEDAHVVKLIDIYWYLGAGVANRLTVDAADEAGVIEGQQKGLHQVRRSRCSY